MNGSPVNKRIFLTLVRHGESIWNKKNLFTGWTDVELTENGIREAIHSGELLLQRQQQYSLGYTSFLQRASETYSHIIKELQKGEGFNQRLLEPRLSWRLNERHYGRLQGLNKAETAEKYGKDKVQEWRRSFDIPPPLSTKENIGIDPKIEKYFQETPPLLGEFKADLRRRYKSASEIQRQLTYLKDLGLFSELTESDFGRYLSGVQNLFNNASLTPDQQDLLDRRQEYQQIRGESLQMTETRVKKWLRREYLRWAPEENILIVAHGNSLRALIKTLENISDQDITSLNIPTGSPILYELDGLAVLNKHYALGEEEMKQRAKMVAEQTSKK